ncbi:MAG TPA: hypothetical protein VGQ89_07350 [Candidatus Limnocylindrales bacterium]|nr:hypothetical protein [Candidatus Limnocylindrales bacterium]
MSDGRLPRSLAFASAAAVGLAAVLPWVGFVGTPVIAPLGLQPAGCDPGDLVCAVADPAWLLTVAAIFGAGALYGVAAWTRTHRGSPSLAAVLTGIVLAAGSLVAYVAVADNPLLGLIHSRLGVGLDELTPWIGIAEAFSIAVFAVAFIVVLSSALVTRARRPFVVAAAAALVAAACFVAVVVIVDAILGIRLGAETIGTRAMPWTALAGNLVAGVIGGLVGLRLIRRESAA